MRAHGARIDGCQIDHGCEAVCSTGETKKIAGTSNQLSLCTESSIGRNVAHLLYGFDTENPWKHFIGGQAPLSSSVERGTKKQRTKLKKIYLKVASYSFLTAQNLVTKKWLMARALKSSRDFARPTRGSPTQEVNKHGFPTLQTLFSSKTCELINFSKCLPTCKKVVDSLESKRRFKKIISRCSEQLMSL